ncbi:Uma2 family endonuclease [Streptomyces sp. N2-109]|uniref:Uma2 family endonuclease n=1 Tax=Streptomyces gossypii TaxID=2883101 RepID=A0ABT2JQ72_9ACTN|nr:Uma2 family endonuclease [Streptomyces gossypii]MCT2590025.1 Uma2 family endonuclease [Streptomyces gossypii]
MAVAYARMREIAEEMSHVPEAWAVEVSGGEITIMMSPAKRHEFIVALTARQLNHQLDDIDPSLVAHGGAEIEDPAAGVMRRPDLLVLPLDSLDEQGDYVDPKEIRVAMEVVSKSNPENDYTGKMRDYPRIGIPCYVIVDPRLGTGVVLSEIGPGEDGGPAYQHRESFTFGETVSVGEWTIDTSQFPLY